MKIKRRYLVNMPYLERLEFISNLPGQEFYKEIISLIADYPDYDQSYLLKALGNKLKKQIGKSQLSDVSFAEIAKLNELILPNNFVQFLNILLNNFVSVDGISEIQYILNLFKLKALPESILKEVYEIFDNYFINLLEKNDFTSNYYNNYLFKIVAYYVLNNPCNKVRILERLLDTNNNQAVGYIQYIISQLSVNDPVRKIIQKQLDVYDIIV